MKLSSLGEFGVIERIQRRIQTNPQVVRGIGDDCAQTRLPAGHELVTSMDLLLDGVHFRRDWASMTTIGRKSVAVNVSDIAAMGGQPHFLYLGLGLPPEISVEQVDAFIDGFLHEAETYGATLVGGDTCRSQQGLTVAVTVEGSVPAGEALGRDGAQPGDDLYVSGSLGDSALALSLLQQNQSVPEKLAQRHFTPQARPALAVALQQTGLVRSMIDLSDGLYADLSHLLAASAVGARFDLERVPLSEAFCRAGGTLEQALTGGEDYELLFSAKPGQQDRIAAVAAAQGVAVTAIGQLNAAAGSLEATDAQGRLWQPNTSGFNHFRG